MHDQFRTFGRYNRWANARLAETLADLDEATYRQDAGAFFGSIHLTWNHLLLVDLLWLQRMGVEVGVAVTTLDQVLYEDRGELLAARAAWDDRIVDFVDQLDPGSLDEPLAYASMDGKRHAYPRRLVLAHLFNHQTHHRGQVHTLLTSLGRNAPALDLIYYLRALPET
ncbi:MAG: damage-inducible protein DinB [Geminicoccaceae bacterium]|nr:MAG: damage-inducible protein DinB [Geminicoccaceae bacterium]